ncbi:hypothetical protein ScPMuIL_012205 [Solemya velum]
MASAKVARDYFISRQSTLLISNRDFGQRKFLHVATKPLTAKQVESVERQKNMQSVNKSWVHPPESLLKGHIVYNVKFLGESEVDGPKGTDIIKEAVRKRKFNKHIKRAEGQKTPRVELTISADGVAIQDPKTKELKYQYPLHRISYCADDKTDKRIVTFIAKAADSNKHFCFVFDSDKCAEEITLTIGQAFDLAYRRFLETGKDSDIKKQYLLLQKKLQNVEDENKALRKRISDLELLKDRGDLEEYKRINHIAEVGEVEVASPDASLDQIQAPNLTLASVSLDESSTDDAPPTPPGSDLLVSVGEAEAVSTVGRRLEGLILEDPPQTNGVVNGNGQTNQAQLLSPPPASGRSRSHVHTNLNTPQQTNTRANPAFDPFGTDFSSSGSDDPFGMGTFNPASPTMDKAIQNLGNKDNLMGGFNQGLSFDDFSLDDLDPLNKKL